MSVTRLDTRSALIVIDLQKGIVQRPTVHPAALVVAQAAFLAEAFRRAALPVVLVNVDGKAPGRSEAKVAWGALPDDWAELVEALHPQAEDIRLTKKSWGAFTATGLETRLRTLGITQVVLAGISTSIGVETTARQAYELGFNVTLALDAMTDMVPAAHENSVTRIFPRLGETGTAAQIAALLPGTAS